MTGATKEDHAASRPPAPDNNNNNNNTNMKSNQLQYETVMRHSHSYFQRRDLASYAEAPLYFAWERLYSAANSKLSIDWLDESYDEFVKRKHARVSPRRGLPPSSLTSSSSSALERQLQRESARSSSFLRASLSVSGLHDPYLRGSARMRAIRATKQATMVNDRASHKKKLSKRTKAILDKIERELRRGTYGLESPLKVHEKERDQAAFSKRALYDGFLPKDQLDVVYPVASSKAQQRNAPTAAATTMPTVSLHKPFAGVSCPAPLDASASFVSSDADDAQVAAFHQSSQPADTSALVQLEHELSPIKRVSKADNGEQPKRRSTQEQAGKPSLASGQTMAKLFHPDGGQGMGQEPVDGDRTFDTTQDTSGEVSLLSDEEIIPITSPPKRKLSGRPVSLSRAPTTRTSSISPRALPRPSQAPLGTVQEDEDDDDDDGDDQEQSHSSQGAPRRVPFATAPSEQTHRQSMSGRQRTTTASEAVAYDDEYGDEEDGDLVVNAQEVVDRRSSREPQQQQGPRESMTRRPTSEGMAAGADRRPSRAMAVAGAVTRQSIARSTMMVDGAMAEHGAEQEEEELARNQTRRSTRSSQQQFQPQPQPQPRPRLSTSSVGQRPSMARVHENDLDEDQSDDQQSMAEEEQARDRRQSRLEDSAPQRTSSRNHSISAASAPIQSVQADLESEGVERHRPSRAMSMSMSSIGVARQSMARENEAPEPGDEVQDDAERRSSRRISRSSTEPQANRKPSTSGRGRVSVKQVNYDDEEVEEKEFFSDGERIVDRRSSRSIAFEDHQPSEQRTRAQSVVMSTGSSTGATVADQRRSSSRAMPVSEGGVASSRGVTRPSVARSSMRDEEEEEEEEEEPRVRNQSRRSTRRVAEEVQSQSRASVWVGQRQSVAAMVYEDDDSAEHNEEDEQRLVEVEEQARDRRRTLGSNAPSRKQSVSIASDAYTTDESQAGGAERRSSRAQSSSGAARKSMSGDRVQDSVDEQVVEGPDQFRRVSRTTASFQQHQQQPLQERSLSVARKPSKSGSMVNEAVHRDDSDLEDTKAPAPPAHGNRVMAKLFQSGSYTESDRVVGPFVEEEQDEQFLGEYETPVPPPRRKLSGRPASLASNRKASISPRGLPRSAQASLGTVQEDDDDDGEEEEEEDTRRGSRSATTHPETNHRESMATSGGGRRQTSSKQSNVFDDAGDDQEILWTNEGVVVDHWSSSRKPSSLATSDARRSGLGDGTAMRSGSVAERRSSRSGSSTGALARQSMAKGGVVLSMEDNYGMDEAYVGNHEEEEGEISGELAQSQSRHESRVFADGHQQKPHALSTSRKQSMISMASDNVATRNDEDDEVDEQADRGRRSSHLGEVQQQQQQRSASMNRKQSVVGDDRMDEEEHAVREEPRVDRRSSRAVSQHGYQVEQSDVGRQSIAKRNTVDNVAVVEDGGVDDVYGDGDREEEDLRRRRSTRPQERVRSSIATSRRSTIRPEEHVATAEDVVDRRSSRRQYTQMESQQPQRQASRVMGAAPVARQSMVKMSEFDDSAIMVEGTEEFVDNEDDYIVEGEDDEQLTQPQSQSQRQQQQRSEPMSGRQSATTRTTSVGRQTTARRSIRGGVGSLDEEVVEEPPFDDNEQDASDATPPKQPPQDRSMSMSRTRTTNRVEEAEVAVDDQDAMDEEEMVRARPRATSQVPSLRGSHAPGRNQEHQEQQQQQHRSMSRAMSLSKSSVEKSMEETAWDDDDVGSEDELLGRQDRATVDRERNIIQPAGDTTTRKRSVMMASGEGAVQEEEEEEMLDDGDQVHKTAQAEESYVGTRSRRSSGPMETLSHQSRAQSRKQSVVDEEVASVTVLDPYEVEDNANKSQNEAQRRTLTSSQERETSHRHGSTRRSGAVPSRTQSVAISTDKRTALSSTGTAMSSMGRLFSGNGVERQPRTGDFDGVESEEEDEQVSERKSMAPQSSLRRSQSHATTGSSSRNGHVVAAGDGIDDDDLDSEDEELMAIVEAVHSEESHAHQSQHHRRGQSEASGATVTRQTLDSSHPKPGSQRSRNTEIQKQRVVDAAGDIDGLAVVVVDEEENEWMNEETVHTSVSRQQPSLRSRDVQQTDQAPSRVVATSKGSMAKTGTAIDTTRRQSSTQAVATSREVRQNKTTSQRDVVAAIDDAMDGSDEQDHYEELTQTAQLHRCSQRQQPLQQSTSNDLTVARDRSGKDTTYDDETMDSEEELMAVVEQVHATIRQGPPPAVRQPQSRLKPQGAEKTMPSRSSVMMSTGPQALVRQGSSAARGARQKEQVQESDEEAHYLAQSQSNGEPMRVVNKPRRQQTRQQERETSVRRQLILRNEEDDISEQDRSHQDEGVEQMIHTRSTVSAKQPPQQPPPVRKPIRNQEQDDGVVYEEDLLQEKEEDVFVSTDRVLGSVQGGLQSRSQLQKTARPRRRQEEDITRPAANSTVSVDAFSATSSARGGREGVDQQRSANRLSPQAGKKPTRRDDDNVSSGRQGRPRAGSRIPDQTEYDDDDYEDEDDDEEDNDGEEMQEPTRGVGHAVRRPSGAVDAGQNMQKRSQSQQVFQKSYHRQSRNEEVVVAVERPVYTEGATSRPARAQEPNANSRRRERHAPAVESADGIQVNDASDRELRSSRGPPQAPSTAARMMNHTTSRDRASVRGNPLEAPLTRRGLPSQETSRVPPDQRQQPLPSRRRTQRVHDVYEHEIGMGESEVEHCVTQENETRTVDRRGDQPQPAQQLHRGMESSGKTTATIRAVPFSVSAPTGSNRGTHPRNDNTMRGQRVDRYSDEENEEAAWAVVHGGTQRDRPQQQPHQQPMALSSTISRKSNNSVAMEDYEQSLSTTERRLLPRSVANQSQPTATQAALEQTTHRNATQVLRRSDGSRKNQSDDPAEVHQRHENADRRISAMARPPPYVTVDTRVHPTRASGLSKQQQPSQDATLKRQYMEAAAAQVEGMKGQPQKKQLKDAVWPPGMEHEAQRVPTYPHGSTTSHHHHHPLAPPGMEHLVSSDQMMEYWTWLHWYSCWQLYYLQKAPSDRAKKGTNHNSKAKSTSNASGSVNNNSQGANANWWVGLQQ